MTATRMILAMMRINSRHPNAITMFLFVLLFTSEKIKNFYRNLRDMDL